MVFVNIYAPVRGVDRNVVLEQVGTLLNKCASEDFLFLGVILSALRITT